MRQSESIAKLAAALVKAQAEVENATKDSRNPHFKSGYASLASVIDTTKPVLSKYGLAVVQMPGFSDGLATLDCRLVHESGEWIEGTAGAPLQKNDPQGVGSALTYLRRYSLAALTGITQEDDDGNAASRAVPTMEYLSEFQAKDIHARIKATGSDEKKFLAHMRALSVERIPANAYETAVRALDAKAAANGAPKAAAK